MARNGRKTAIREGGYYITAIIAYLYLGGSIYWGFHTELRLGIKPENIMLSTTRFSGYKPKCMYYL
jgi:hypothetical protein